MFNGEFSSLDCHFCMHSCMSLCICMSACVYVCMCVHVYACMYVRIRVCKLVQYLTYSYLRCVRPNVRQARIITVEELNRKKIAFSKVCDE